MGTRGVDPERPPCPACRQVQVPAGHLMCAVCWRGVPKQIQRGVMLALRQWRRDPTDERWYEYVAHREQALQAVNQ